MSASDDSFNLTDLADDTLTGPEWDAWLAANPDLAAEVAVARQVRGLLLELGAFPVAPPADFVETLLERVGRDATILDLLDLWLSGFGRALVELLNALFALPPAAEPTPAA